MIRLNTYNKPIYNYFEVPLQVLFAREGRVANGEGSVIGTFTIHFGRVGPLVLHGPMLLPVSQFTSAFFFLFV